jgi:hypothetical protein
LDKAAKSLWVSIVSSKPADWFDPGSYALLAEYCQITARHKKLAQELEELDRQKPTDPLERQLLRNAVGELEDRILKHARTSGSLAARLRLAVQNTIDRRSGILTEKPPEAAAVAPRNSLLSGRRLDS